MADIKISNLTAASALMGTEAIPVVQGGATLRSSPDALKTFLAAPTDYAAIYVYDGSTAQTIGTGSTPVKLTAFAAAAGANSESSGAVADKDNSKITVTRTGRYLVSYSISYTGNGNNITWESYVFANGVRATDTGAMSKIGTGSDTQCISGVGIVALTAGQDLDLRIYHNNIGSQDITVSHASLVAVQIS